MNFIKRNLFVAVFCFAAFFVFSLPAIAQTQKGYEVLTDADLTKIVPTSFYFAGQSAETQMRNAAAASVGKDRFVIAGLVDTSGYSTEISGKYEGFLITDSPLKIGGQTLNTGAYGFGFAKNGKINIFDLSSKQILSIKTAEDAELKRPRPLAMVKTNAGIRLYRGKTYVVIAAK